MRSLLFFSLALIFIAGCEKGKHKSDQADYSSYYDQQYDDGREPLRLETTPPSSSYESSCLNIYQAGLGQADGVYTIDPDGSGPIRPFQVFCKMVDPYPGWTLVVNAPDGGYPDIEVVADGQILDLSLRGRLHDQKLVMLLARAGIAGVVLENNLKVITPRFTVSMAISEARVGHYRVSPFANGNCDQYELEADHAEFSTYEQNDFPNWSFANGSRGGNAGFFSDKNARGRYGEFRGFYWNADTCGNDCGPQGGDKMCNRYWTSGIYESALPGQVWIR
ncbi:MAG: hypothetical protein KDD43_07135 [Bdellovibrionales bacterium]|nr:hypothetical protein [Bdellovibrionales bacterium]